MHLVLHLLPFLPFIAALPHTKQQNKKSLSIGFTQRNINPRATSPLERRHRKRQSTSATDDTAELLNDNNVRYIATVQIAGQELDLILDTGSTDTFVLSAQPDDYQGVDASLLPALFDNSTAQGVTYTGLQYNASYGSGDGITTTLGAIGLAPTSINGTTLTANNLTFANLYQSSDGTGASGLIGLGFPLNGDIFLTICEAFNATGEPLTIQQASAYYPLVPTLQQQGQISSSIFSLVVDRIPTSLQAPSDATVFNYTMANGTFTIGDYPEGYTESQFTFSPVPTASINELGQSIGIPGTTGNRWTTPLEYVYFNGLRLTNTTQQPSIQDDEGYFFALVDSGNPSLTFPSDMMAQITNAYAGNPSNAVIPCDSDFELILQFAGKNFTLAKEDILVPSYLAIDSLDLGGSTSQQCQFQAQPDDPTEDEFGPFTSITYQFGDPLLRNVAMVFDYGNVQDSTTSSPRMGFVQR